MNKVEACRAGGAGEAMGGATARVRWGWESSGLPDGSSMRAKEPQAYAMGAAAWAAGRALDLCPFWQPFEADAARRWREGWMHEHVLEMRGPQFWLNEDGRLEQMPREK